MYWELAKNGKISEFFDSFGDAKKRAEALRADNPEMKIKLITGVCVIEF